MSKLLPQFTLCTFAILTWTLGLLACLLSANAAHATEPVRITFDGYFKQRPDWSPDGEQVVFARHVDDTILLYLLDLTSGTERRLTNRSEPEYDAVFAPDGESLLLAIDRTSPNQGDIDVFRLTLATGDLEPIAVSEGGLSFEEWPCWSPKGDRVAYTSTREGNQELYVADRDGGNSVRLTNDPAIDAHPCWSPDGTLLAFATNRWGDLEIALISVDGGALRRFTHSVGLDDYPAFSPDGRYLAWTTNRLGSLDLAIANVHNGEIVQIIGTEWGEGFSIENFPTWISESRIGFVSNLDGQFDLYTLDLEVDKPLAESQNPQQEFVLANLLPQGVPPETDVCAAEARREHEEEPPLSPEELETMREEWLSSVRMLSEAIAVSPMDVSLYSRRGDALLFLGKFKEALADYQQMLELSPELEAAHWRRGIAAWFAGEYSLGANQFSKYHTFDAVDRENGLWKFLCDARRENLAVARREMLVYESDDRASLPDVYRLYAGDLSPDELLRTVHAAAEDADDLDRRLFYTELYLGFYFLVQSQEGEAREHLNACLRTRFGRQAGYGPRYMWHVARLAYEELQSAREE